MLQCRWVKRVGFIYKKIDNPLSSFRSTRGYLSVIGSITVKILRFFFCCNTTILLLNDHFVHASSHRTLFHYKIEENERLLLINCESMRFYTTPFSITNTYTLYIHIGTIQNTGPTSFCQRRAILFKIVPLNYLQVYFTQK